MDEREHLAQLIQGYWQGASGTPWNECCQKRPAEADWFRRLADIIIHDRNKQEKT